MASGIPGIIMGPQGWQLVEKRKNGRSNKTQQMRADAMVMGLLPGSSVSQISTATPIPLRNDRTLESDDACTQTQSIRSTNEDARLYSAPSDVLLSPNRNITPTIHDDSCPVTYVPGISTQEMLIRDWKEAGYHKAATVLTSELPKYFENLVRHSKSADTCCQQSGVMLISTSRFQPVNFGFHRCWAENQVAITWPGEASDSFSNAAGRGFLCRITQDLRDRDRLLDNYQPILRFGYNCKTCHLDDPSISFPPQFKYALSPFQRRVLRKRKGRRSSRSTSTTHSNSSDIANEQMESPRSDGMYQHNRNQSRGGDLDPELPDRQVTPREDMYGRSATKGGTILRESQSSPSQPNDITGDNGRFMTDR